MKKFLFIFSLLLAFATASHAQWVSQPAGYTQPGLLTFGLKVVNENVVWGVGLDTAFTQPVRSFTRTVNGGATWTTGQVGGLLAFGQQVVNVTAIDGNTAWVTTFDMNFFGGSRVYKTTNGGTSWTHQSSASFSAPDGFATGIHFFNANDGVVVGMVNGGYFEIYTTSNGGTTWTRVPAASIPAPLFGYEDVSIGLAYSGNSVWFITGEGRVFRSTNKGLTWAASNTGLYYGELIAFQDDQNGLAIGDGDIARTTNGGQTWSLVNNTGPVFSEGLSAVPGQPGTYVSTGGAFGYSPAGSSFTIDNGLNWYYLENNTLHMSVGFANPTTGFSGGFSQSATSGGIHKWSGPLQCTPIVSGLASAYCISEGPVTLNPIPATGTFTGAGITGNIFSPALAGVGTHAISYDVFSGPCQGNVLLYVTVGEPVPVSISGLPSTPVASSSPSITLTGNPAGGIFSGEGISGNNFNPSSAGGGVHTISYTVIENGCTLTTSQNVTVIGPPGYCTSNLYYSGCYDGDRIDLFTFHTINNPTNNCPPNAYNDFTNMSANVDRGQTYNLSVQANPAYEQGFGVWIDYNQNGNFDDPGEFVWESPGIGTQLFTGTVSIPANALLGSTRLRVRAFFSYSPMAGDACMMHGYGETEDYTVVITSATPVTDVSSIGFSNPLNGCNMTANEQVCMLIKNQGNTPLTNIEVSYTIGGTTITDTIPGPLAPMDFIQHCFAQTTDLSAAGNYSIIGTAQVTGDMDLNNNIFTHNFTHFSTLQATIVGLAPEYCINTGPILLTGSPSGGTFSGNGVNGNYLNPWIFGPGVYNVTYTVSLPGCGTATTTQQVTITYGPYVFFTGLPGNSMCVNTSPVTLIPTPAGGTFYGTGVTGNIFNPALAGPGYHQIHYNYTDALGCTGVHTEYVFVDEVPNSNFTHSNNGSVFQFNYPSAGFIYNWQFGDGSTSQAQNPQHTYTTSGSHTVTLTVSTGGNCSSTSSQTIVVSGTANVLSSQIKIYPNPAHGFLLIEAPDHGSDNFELLSIQGQVILSQKLNGAKQARIDLQGIAEGAYMVRIHSAGSVLVKPVMLHK